MTDIQHLPRPDGETLAFKRVDGDGPTVIWVGGFRSDMEGTKALALDVAARERGWNFVRYDHFAHGQSSGDWRQATIGRWREDAVALIDSLSGPVIPVGSSMGGWVSLLTSLARPDRIKGLVLVNPAQDFTERLMWPGLADHERQAILREGEKEPFDVKMTRETIKLTVVKTRIEGHAVVLRGAVVVAGQRRQPHLLLDRAPEAGQHAAQRDPHDQSQRQQAVLEGTGALKIPAEEGVTSIRG